MSPEIIAGGDRVERERYDKFLSHLGFVHKGKFNPKDHDFTLDNYVPIGDNCIMFTLDSTKVLNCHISEYWEVQDTENTNPFFTDGFLEKIINALKDLHYGVIAT